MIALQNGSLCLTYSIEISWVPLNKKLLYSYYSAFILIYFKFSLSIICQCSESNGLSWGLLLVLVAPSLGNFHSVSFEKKILKPKLICEIPHSFCAKLLF